MHRLISHRPYSLLLVRDFCWRRKKWQTPELTEWLDSFQPEAVFMQCSAPAIYEIAFWICARYDIPFFLEITDDYTSPCVSFNPFFWRYLHLMRRAMSRAISLAETTLVIGEKMRDEYMRRFGGRYYIAMNAVEVPELLPPAKNEKLRVVYTGNLGLNRWQTVEQLGKACNRNTVLRQRVRLDIYSASTLSPEIISRLNTGVMTFHGKALASEVYGIQAQADVLLHVEAFNRKSRYITRYSISTKISEYLASGRCILAVGPEDVASIEYLKKYQLAVVVTENRTEAMCRKMQELISDPALRTVCIHNARSRAKAYHSAEKVVADVRAMIISAVECREK